MTTSHDNDVTTYFRIRSEDMPRIHEHDSTPNYTSMDRFQVAINDCALAIPSMDTDLGHFAIVVKAPTYTEANDGTPWTPPMNPGTAPTAPPTIARMGLRAQQPDPNNPAEIAAHAAAALLNQAPDHFAIQEALRRFTQQQKAYNTYTNATKALRNLILNAVDDQYINELKHINTGYVKVSPLALLDHLWTEYGTIDGSDLTQNEKRMKAPWNPPAPIENLFKQLKTGQEFAFKGSEVITESVMLRYGYENIEATGLFKSPNTIWRAKDDVDKTWKNFKKHYTAAYIDIKKNTTVEAAGYSVNAIQEIVRNEIGAALFNVDQAPLHEPEPSYYPPESANAAVTMEQLKDLIATLIKPQEKKKKNLKGQAKNEDGQWITYCHTHGVTTNLSHTSSNCSRKKDGHKDAATLSNRMGGSDVINKKKPRE